MSIMKEAVNIVQLLKAKWPEEPKEGLLLILWPKNQVLSSDGSVTSYKRLISEVRSLREAKEMVAEIDPHSVMFCEKTKDYLKCTYETGNTSVSWFMQPVDMGDEVSLGEALVAINEESPNLLKIRAS